MYLTDPIPTAPLGQRFGEHVEYYRQFGYLRGHPGWDFPAPIGTEVRAASIGKLYVANESGGYGNYCMVFGEGVDTLYAHLSKHNEETLTLRGEVVWPGQVIAHSGNTGNSIGPHLHFGVRPKPLDYHNGSKGYVDPAPYLPSRRENMGTKLGAHIQVLRRENTATLAHLRRALYPSLKVMVVDTVDPSLLVEKVFPAYREAGLPTPEILPRVWTDDIRDECVRAGRDGARRWAERVLPGYTRYRDLFGCVLVSSVNEFIPYTDEDARRHNEFEYCACAEMERHGFLLGVGEFSVGWPKLEHWQYYRDALQRCGALFKHEYAWAGHNDRGEDMLWYPWHVRRYELDIAKLASLGYRIPPIYLTEIGWDEAVITGANRGFRNYSNADVYLEWLKTYDAYAQTNEAIQSCHIFQTGAASDWREYDVVGSAVDASLANYVNAHRERPEQSEPDPVDYRNWAFPKYAREHGLGAPMVPSGLHSNEIDAGPYRFGMYANGVCYCLIGDWGNVSHFSW